MTAVSRRKAFFEKKRVEATTEKKPPPITPKWRHERFSCCGGDTLFWPPSSVDVHHKENDQERGRWHRPLSRQSSQLQNE
jgi:hypothetical protein